MASNADIPVMLAQGRKITPSGVVITDDPTSLPMQIPGHGAVGMTSNVHINSGDVTGPFTQVKLDVWLGGVEAVPASFEEHCHDGEFPMGELFVVISGVTEFSFRSSLDSPQMKVEIASGGSIYFPPAVYHSGRNSGMCNAQLVIIGVREVQHPCDDGAKGFNIPA